MEAVKAQAPDPAEGGGKAVLVVKVPKADIETKVWRDYIIESLAVGVLVFGPGVTWQVEHFPHFGGVRVEQLPERKGTAPPAGRSAGSSAEKSAILERLRVYRQAHGLGCLDALAARCGGSITADVLRDVLSGAAVLSLQNWRRIRRGIDLMEQQGGRTR